MKRILVLTLGLTLLVAASAGTASARLYSGDQAIDSERDLPKTCIKKAFPHNPSDIVRGGQEFCRQKVPANPCLRVRCDPPPVTCHVVNRATSSRRLPCPPSPCPTRTHLGPPGADALNWVPCPIPLPPPVTTAVFPFRLSIPGIGTPSASSAVRRSCPWPDPRAIRARLRLRRPGCPGLHRVYGCASSPRRRGRGPAS